MDLGNFADLTPLFSQNVSDARFVAWDTETTGASPASDHLVEIAGIAFDEEFEQRRFETLIKPPVQIPSAVIRIHGISDDTVRHAPETREGLQRFFEFLDFVGTPRILLAHNAGFDVGMVHEGWKRLASPPPVTVSPEIVIDTCMLAKALLPDLPSHRLGLLAEKFGVADVRFHRAMADVQALHVIFLNLLGIAADLCTAKGAGLTIETLIDLAGGYFELNPKSAAVRRQPFRLPPRIAALEPLCGTDSKVGILYAAEDYRYITPVAIRLRGFKVYVEAFCHRDNIKKTFRADKILKIGKVEAAT